MKFLLDANMPRSAAKALVESGHQVEDVRDVLPPGASDASVAARAKTNALVLVTRDFDFADIRNYPPENYPGIIVLDLPDDTTAAQVSKTLATFAQNTDFLKRLPGRLAIVDSWRVRFRPA